MTASNHPTPASCQPARALLATAIEHGWSAAWLPGTSTSGHPWVEVRAARYDSGADQEVRVTWHTHRTGTYRLHSAITRGGPRGWHDITLTRAKQLLTTGATEGGA